MIRSSRLFPAVLLAGALTVAIAGVGHAQSDPSADQIINSLKPTPGMTRGIRPVAPETPEAKPAAHAAPSVSLSVQFATNSAVLSPRAIRTLTELGHALSSSTLAGDRFRIEGHTDTVGSPEANKELSARRAQAVIAFLTGSFKIDPARLEAVGMGEEGLLVPTPPNTAEARNRRVQVVNLGT